METKDFKFKFSNIDEKEGVFTGLASVYDVIDSYNETVTRGAFKKTLQENDGKFPLCWGHNVMEPLGLVVAKDSKKGLRVEGSLNLDVQSAKEKRSLMKQGAVSGLSIGFQTLKDEWDDDVRKLKEIKLYEVSLITRNFQACPGADITDVKDNIPEELKPYPNEHSARLKEPDGFDKFKRKADGTIYGSVKVPSTIDVIWGHLKGEDDDAWAPQTLRFPTKDWTATEAKAWLKKNKIKYIKFEPASKSLEGILERILTIEKVDNLSSESYDLIQQSITQLKSLTEGIEPPEGTLESLLEPIKNFNESLKGLENFYSRR